MDNPTICVKCRHLIRKPDSRPDCQGIWYNLFCGAIERDPGTDFVTGESGYMEQNSLGMPYITDDKHPHAREINKTGNCEYYDPK